MMRTGLVAAVFAIIAVPALGADTTQPIESVTVSDNSLVGIWKINMPQGFDFAFAGKTKWGPNADVFCQIEKIRTGLSIHCLGFRMRGGDVSRGSLSIRRNSLRMTWGSMWMYAAINGTLRSATQFDGAFSVQALGVSDDAPGQVTGTRLVLSQDTPDKAGKSGLLASLLDDMAKGAPSNALDPPATNIRVLKPDTLRALGSIQSIIYVGETTSTISFPVSVYDVEFSDGHLICSLHQGPDDKLDQFDCG